ncbi:hypothetical protein [Streptomyces sp. NPDC053079]|uniref:hypothetical protein n=1 Tax=Streptomyces sp. NPDC053079 TaxID=3365697 RepID=UPI0037D5DA8C
MPTPYGSRGGMAFSADELRVLRRALDIALRPHSVPTSPGPAREAEAKDCLLLAEAVDEAVREGDRLRAFLLQDLARYRAALPGAAPGYVLRLRDALLDGYRPGAEDLAALRALCAEPAGEAEATRRHTLLARCEHLAEQAVRARLAARAAAAAAPAVPTARPPAAPRTPPPPAARPHLQPPPAASTHVQAPPAAHPHPQSPPPHAGTRLQALPGGRAPRAAEPEPRPGPKPGESPAPPNRPAPGPPPEAPRPKPPAAPRPGRPIPTPGEVFPPRRKPVPPLGARALAAARPA